MNDLKYHELVKWLQNPENVKIEKVDPSLDVPFWAFVANIKSVLSLAIFPAGAVHAEKLNQFIHDVIVYRKTGQLGSPVDVDMTGQEMTEVVLELQQSGPIMGIRSLVDAARAFEHQVMAEEKVRDGLLALFSSSLVGTWTAFETLGDDLWETAVNLRPGLATNISKNISTNLVQKYGFSVGSKMGTILWEMDSVRFDSLEKIRGAYKETFVEHADSISELLKDKTLDALSTVRNLIVHKGGRCDAEYKRKASGLPQIPQLEIGDMLPLDGVLVRELMQPGFKVCKKLLQTVDNWLRISPT